MMEMFVKGRPIMWPILACSVAALTITLYKSLHYGGILRRMSVTKAQGDFSLPGALVHLVEVIRAGVDEKGLELVASRQIRGLERGLGSLSLISVISPLLGLIGTVLGMIQTFQMIGAHGSRVDPGMLAGGIWQALIITAAGLLVANPSRIALYYLEGRMESIVRHLTELLERHLGGEEPWSLSAQEGVIPKWILPLW